MLPTRDDIRCSHEPGNPHARGQIGTRVDIVAFMERSVGRVQGVVHRRNVFESKLGALTHDLGVALPDAARAVSMRRATPARWGGRWALWRSQVSWPWTTASTMPPAPYADDLRIAALIGWPFVLGAVLVA